MFPGARKPPPRRKLQLDVPIAAPTEQPTGEPVDPAAQFSMFEIPVEDVPVPMEAVEALPLPPPTVSHSQIFVVKYFVIEE